MSLYAPYAHSAHRGQKTVSDSLELNMDAGNQIQIHWQSAQYSTLRQLVLQPAYMLIRPAVLTPVAQRTWELKVPGWLLESPLSG